MGVSPQAWGPGGTSLLAGFALPPLMKQKFYSQVNMERIFFF
jgi:hypothetical protein